MYIVMYIVIQAPKIRAGETVFFSFLFVRLSSVETEGPGLA
jgi:hypothetical protein